MKSRFVCILSALLFAMVSGALRAETRVAPELQIVAAQPAVFTVIVRGDFDLTYPKRVSLNKQQLASDATALKQAGMLAEATNIADELWIALMNDPSRYLIISTETETKFVRNRVFGSGTAFAISREGILLSNAHVFAHPDVQTIKGLCNDAQLQIEHGDPTANMLVREIGAEPSEALRTRIAYGLLEWTGLTMTATGRFNSAELVLKYDAPKQAFANNFFKAPIPITIPLEILAIGEPAPGKDVAVLRAIMRPGDRQKLRAAGARDDEMEGILERGQNDKFICLPLSSSRDILPGTKVQALGFPGSSNNDWMTEAALYRVSARDGQVGQTKPVRGGYDMIEMTAGIDHGDSGGPVIDTEGRVIAINVGGGTNNATTLAVPIFIAQEFLDKAGVTPNPGKLTDRWYEALAAYKKGDFSQAAGLFELIARNQGCDMMLDALPNPLDPQPAQPLGRNAWGTLLTPNFVNPYVTDMQRRAVGKHR